MIKKKRGRPKGSVSKDKPNKIDRTKRKTDLAKKVLRSGVSVIDHLLIQFTLHLNI